MEKPQENHAKMSTTHFRSSVVIFFNPRYWFVLTWHLFLVIIHHFRSKCASELVPIASFSFPRAPLGLFWAPLWTPLDPLWRPLASLLPCQDTSWGQSCSFPTPKSDFEKIFHWFSMFSYEILLFSVSFLHISFEGFISLSLISAHPSSHASYYCSARKEQKAVYGKCVYVAREVTDQSSSD